MRILKVIVLIHALLFLSCAPAENISEFLPEDVRTSQGNIDGYTKIFTLKDKKGQILGDVYAEYINDKIFTSLIIKDSKGILYLINKTNFVNKKGIDLTIKTDENNPFYGYEIALMKDNYIELYYRSNGGENISDLISILWDAEEQLFRVERSP